MQWFASNWIWIVFAVGMIAMHLFGHGGHGGRSRHGSHDDGNDPQEAKKSVEAEPVADTTHPAGVTHDHVRVPSLLKSTDDDRRRDDRS